MKSAQLLYSALIRSFLKWIILGSVVGIFAGSASAIFLTSLEWVTDERLSHPWLLYLLPVGGALISYLYLKLGKNSAKGNNLILEQIHEGGNETIPLRMAPLVLIGTLATHLFGGSAGREGTAIQMGGSLSEVFGKWIKADSVDRKILLMCGISGGFGSVFGTPLAGTVFGLEVIAIGFISYEALIPCFTASFVGHLVTTELWGVQHMKYPVIDAPALSGMVVVKVVIAALLFTLVSILFSELTHMMKKGFAFVFRNPVLKSAAGGLIIISLVMIVGSRDYLGLGLPLLHDALHDDVSPFVFLWKLLFTSVTLGSGFQGGEVTPLFVIGATMGNALAGWLHLAAPFLAALGLIAVFCGATHTPIACFILGIELFGSSPAIYMFMVCVITYVFSGYSGIYTSQYIGISKSHHFIVPADSTLGEIRRKHKKDLP
ncbi:voltage-gated chloride channel family protein [Paenibacillus pini]|uniref:Chloride channel protein n=1 Tax=Paenibacillus pini JCM 16418 TaxID=1236976 RepID=W7YSV1_9BACL|nr:voltage-gated chloride channel family protein [Paenibacillus pini]GAF07706.1 chloride channel protein [Paenibacillus pini JCM 16418]